MLFLNNKKIIYSLQKGFICSMSTKAGNTIALLAARHFLVKRGYAKANESSFLKAKQIMGYLIIVLNIGLILCNWFTYNTLLELQQQQNLFLDVINNFKAEINSLSSGIPAEPPIQVLENPSEKEDLTFKVNSIYSMVGLLCILIGLTSLSSFFKSGSSDLGIVKLIQDGDSAIINHVTKTTNVVLADIQKRDQLIVKSFEELLTSGSKTATALGEAVTKIT